MKFAVSFLFLTIHVKGTRLIQVATCAVVDCQPGNSCYDTSNGPVCCDPNICEAGSCGGNGLHECGTGYECVVTSCPHGLTDCPGVCINPSAQPIAGDSCGKQGIDCAGLKAPALTCSDGSCYGNCGGCIYKQDIYGNLNCEPELIAKEDVCPCAGLENCDSWSPDGCNTCSCPKEGTLSFCTLIACPTLQIKPECRICSAGYILNVLTKQCEPTLTCANVLCAANTMCYETSTGPACCDPNICQSGICGGIGGFQCAVGYECVNDPVYPCDPKTTSDCAGVCVDFDAVPKENVGCGIDHCNSYFDGCNYCSCHAFGLAACTEMACKTLLESYCTGCEAGYILNLSTNKCEGGEACICPMVFSPVCCDGITYSNSCVARCQQATGECTQDACPITPITPITPISPIACCDPNDAPGVNGNALCFEGHACCPDGTYSCSIGDGTTFPCGGQLLDTTIHSMGKECCGGFANCESYNDGCNDCVCGENGDGCTKKLCFTQGTPKCNECTFSHKVNDENGECVSKIYCVRNNDCDANHGFKCTEDPICGGPKNSNPLCANAPKVCFDRESVGCTSDTDCDTTNGFKCFGININGSGVCGRYE